MKYIFVVFLLLFMSCNYSSKVEKENRSNEYMSFSEQLDSLYKAEFGIYEPGAALLIAYKGEAIIKRGFGLRDLEKKLPITPQTNLRIGSVSKQLTALTVLSMVDQGKISFEDSVYPLFPYETFKGVTVGQLLHHTSGIADAEEAIFDEWDSEEKVTNEDIVEWYTSKNRQVTKPGEIYEYNNGAYDFLTSVVEKISGQNFALYAKENVFNKTGMLETNFIDITQPGKIKNKALCYNDGKNRGEWENVDGHFLDGVIGAGGVYTSINDYFHLDNALRNGIPFSKSTQESFFKPSPTGWLKRKANGNLGPNDEPEKATMFAGFWIGTEAFVKRYLDRPLTIVILMNRIANRGSELIHKTDSLTIEYINLIDSIQTVNDSQ